MIIQNNWEPKLWGKTKLVHHQPGYSLHFCEGEKGGFSSIHYHLMKWNRFIVRSAVLKIFTGSVGTETILQPGEFMDVKPGLRHGFEVLSPGGFWECYWSGDLFGDHVDLSDIVRITTGGRR